MNIGIVIPGFSANEDDWCIPVYLNLVRTLARSDTVSVFALRYPARRVAYVVYGARVFAIGGRYDTAGVGRWFLLARTVREIVRQHRARPFDVLHAIWADETGFAAWVAGRILRVPVVVSVAGGELVGLPGYGLQAGTLSRWLVTQSLTRPDCVIAPCQYAADLIRRTALRPRRLEIVPLGVDTDLFSSPAMPPQGDNLLAVGSLTGVKGHVQLLRALACLPEASLEIAGEGPRLPELRGLAASRGVAERVRFLGPVAHDALPDVYRRATIHVLTSQHEAFGMVVTEAASCAVPTVGFALGVLNELADAGAGIAVPPGDIDALTAAIRDLLTNPERRISMGARARAEAESRYAVGSMTNGIRDVYASLV